MTNMMREQTVSEPESGVSPISLKLCPVPTHNSVLSHFQLHLGRRGLRTLGLPRVLDAFPENKFGPHGLTGRQGLLCPFHR